MKALHRVIFNLISFQINIGVLGVNIWKVWIVKSINQSFRKSWMSVISINIWKKFLIRSNISRNHIIDMRSYSSGVKVNFPNNDECQLDRCCQSSPKYRIIKKYKWQTTITGINSWIYKQFVNIISSCFASSQIEKKMKTFILVVACIGLSSAFELSELLSGRLVKRPLIH